MRPPLKKKPEFINVYYCPGCDMDFSYIDDEKPFCRVCDEPTDMKFVEKLKITPQVMADRLKVFADRMMAALNGAYESIDEEVEASFPEDEDAEKMMLELMAKAKNFQEEIEKLELKAPEDSSEEEI